MIKTSLKCRGKRHLRYDMCVHVKKIIDYEFNALKCKCAMKFQKRKT